MGKPATPGLAEPAEDGMPGTLSDELKGLDSVFQYAMADGDIMPGASVTVEIKTKRGFRYLSAAGMLDHRGVIQKKVDGQDTGGDTDVVITHRRIGK